MTSICFSPDGKLLFAGCWDKTVWSWEIASGKPQKRYEGHTDFVRSVTSTRLRGQDLLVSGGADKQILVFDIASAQRLHVLKGHIKGIQDLAIDPVSAETESAEHLVFSAGSDREIRHFDIAAGSSDLTGTEPLIAHDTSVYKLFFDSDGDLWTASADKTAKCLVREDGWKANLTLEHPDFVKDVVVYEQGGWVITVCRDEEVRVWNRSVRSRRSQMIWNSLTPRIARLDNCITHFLATSKRLQGLHSWDQQLSVSVLMLLSVDGPSSPMSFKLPWKGLGSLRQKTRRTNPTRNPR